MKSRHAQHQAAVAARTRTSARLVLKGVALNAVMVVVKLAGGIWGNTYALIADAVESLLDIATSLLIWAGLQWAAQPPDENHPYGHGKAEALAAMAVGSVILAVSVWIGSHAVREIITPHAGPHWFTLPLLAGVVVTKTWFSRRLAQSAQEHGSTSVEAEAAHQGTDALTSGAAFIGIAIALVGGPGYETADDWSALIACVVIAWNGVRVFNQALGDIMDVAVPSTLEAEVRAVASAVPGVSGLDQCRIRKSGLSYLVDIHVVVQPTLTVRTGHEIAHAVKDALLASPLHIGDVLVHIEPLAE